MKKAKQKKKILNANSKLDLREELLKIGTQHFLKEGSNGISVRKIAEKGKVNLGSFVYHFENKENFIHELILRNYENFLSKFNVELNLANEKISEKEKLRFLFLQMAKIEPEFSEFIYRIFIETLQGNTYLIKIFKKNLPKHAAAIIAIIKSGQEKKEFRQDMSAVELMFICMVLTFMPQVLMRRLYAFMSASPINLIFEKFLSHASFEKRLDIALKGIKYES